MQPVPVREMILNLGALSRVGVVARPSVAIKSPYVASVLQNAWTLQQNPFSLMYVDDDGLSQKDKKKFKDKAKEIVAGLAKEHEFDLAHAPSLDCAGMLVAGQNAFVSKNEGTATKTACTIQLCEEERLNEDNVLVGYHPALAEKIAKSLLEKGLLSEDLGEIDKIASQRTFGNSRVDFILEGKDNTLTLLEVKNVVGAEYLEGSVPKTRSKVGVYEVKKSDLPTDGGRHAIFPHGSLKPGIGVVSDRAIKHVTELGQLHGQVDEATGRIIKTAVLFVVNRSDTSAFRPAHEACPVFAQSLKRAQSKGTLLLAKEVVWRLCSAAKGDEAKGEMKEMQAFLGKSLPVCFHESVTEDVDEEHLQRILKYNAEVPKTRSPPPSGKKRKVKYCSD